jgi:hypothetical protein
VPQTAIRLTLAAGLLLAAPASASAAPQLQPLKPCYDSLDKGKEGTEPVIVNGSGFTPSARVDIAVDGAIIWADVPAVDTAGFLDGGTVPAPYVESGHRRFNVTVTERTNPAQTVTASSFVASLFVEVTPRKATPRSLVRFKGDGFTAAAPVYAHYVHKGKARKTVRLVKRPAGRCGRFSVKRRQFPFIPSVGSWRIRIDQRRTWTKKPPDTPYLVLQVKVRAG